LPPDPLYQPSRANHLEENARIFLPKKTLNLPLFMPGIRADDAHNTLAADDLAVLAQPFYRGLDLHGSTLSLLLSTQTTNH
jgi:hypothetical protein